MRTGRFLKRLIKSESDDDSDKELGEPRVRVDESVELGETGSSTDTDEDSSQVDAPSSDEIGTESTESQEAMFATKAELEEAGIDLTELFDDETAASEDSEMADAVTPESAAHGDVEKDRGSSTVEVAPDSGDSTEPELSETGAATELGGRIETDGDLEEPTHVEDEDSSVERERSLARSAVNAGFVITLATELRTPISSLRVSFDLLKDPEAIRSNPEESKRLVGNIERSIARLERQASDLLEVGYIHTGSLTLIKQSLNINEPILAAIDISRAPAAQRQVSLELEMVPDIPTVIADGFRLTQIMTHLLSNAIKFTPVGESVVISISSSTPDVSGENQQQNGDAEPESIVVRVTDHGPGIREAHFERIFEPFYRITGEGIEGGAGVGLGLAIAKGLVELHSGEIWVRSTPKQGTEFGFSIPLS